MRSCLSVEEIALYVEGTATISDLGEFEHHIDGCGSCRQSIAAAVRAGRDADAEREPGSVLPRGTAVGRYNVIDVIGSGGMGVVYSAFDPELGRKVALKLLRDGESTGDAPARLAREAKSLALLSHPNVVTVYDIGKLGGETFVAMELVAGTTLRSWLAASPRSVVEIVAVFQQAGRGLAAAHVGGLVHRDFKPENVLVSADGRVRVTDFGLARAIDDAAIAAPADAPVSSLTRSGTVLGTVAYMSPEQLRGEPADPRSDQFSFFVALHEAQFGQRPFKASTVGELRELFERDAPPETGDTARVPAWLRQVVRRGLERDPRARFASMDAAVEALGHTPRRARRWIAASVAVVAAGAVTTLIATRGSADSAPVCRGAAARLANVWDPGRKRAVHEAFVATRRPFALEAAASTEKILDRYTSTWVTVATETCEATRVEGTQSEALLDLRMACLDDRLTDARALIDVFAKADASIVENAPRAAQQLGQIAACSDTAALTATIRPPSDASARDVKQLSARLAEVRALRQAGKAKDAAASVGAIVERATALAYAPLTAEALLVRGVLESDLDDKAAEKTLVRAADVAEAGRADVIKAEAWTQLVRSAAQRAQYADAHRYAAHATAVLARLGTGHDAISARLANFEGGAYVAEGDYKRALELQQHALDVRERISGPMAPEVATSLNSVGNVHYNLGNYPEARKAYERALAIRQEVFGPTHPDVAGSHNNLAVLLNKLGEDAAALEHYQRAKTINDALFGKDSTRSGQVLGNIAGLYHDMGRYDEAIAAATEGLAIQEKALGADHPLVGAIHFIMGNVYYDKGDYAHALVSHTHAYEIRRAKFGDEHADVLASRRALGMVALAKGDAAGARRTFESVLATQEKLFGADNPDVATTHDHLGQALGALGDTRGALAHEQRAFDLDVKVWGPDNPALVQDLVRLGGAKLANRDAKGAVVLLERALVLATTPGLDQAHAQFALAGALWETKPDRSRAIELAKAGRATLAGAGSGGAHDLAQVDRWLAAHRL